MSKKVERFLAPQETAYPRALEEVRNGRKISHWMWYIFPQLRGLGQSTTAWYYGIEDLEEAKAYLAHPVLGYRLREITQALLDLSETDPVKIFGWIDSMKLRSCMTLFAYASYEALFSQVLEKFYLGQEDTVTSERLTQKRLQP
jgi:uncharacterized protein (DUF1810 family)